MAYKQSGSEKIRDNRELRSKNVTVTTVRRKYGTQPLSNGYLAGGISPVLTPAIRADIQKFPFASNANATDTSGDLLDSTSYAAGAASATHSFVAGGSEENHPTPAQSDRIQKYPFAITSGTSSEVGNLTVGRRESTGHTDGGSGFIAGGWGGFGYSVEPNPNDNIARTTIDKFSFASDGNAVNVGDQDWPRRNAAGSSSSTHGYASGGTSNPNIPGDVEVRIERFPFATGVSAAVGSLTEYAGGIKGGNSSSTHGYRSGGVRAPSSFYSPQNIIDKFPFAAATANATDVGDLTAARTLVAGSDSTTHAHIMGGASGATYYNIIEKTPFASDANGADVGDLLAQSITGVGSQG